MQEAKLSPEAGIPLGKHTIVESCDLELAGRAVSREIGSHRFELATSADEPKVRLSCARLPRTRIFGVQLGSNVHASSVPFTSLQIVVPLSGYVACQRRAHQPPIRPGAALVLRPSDPVDLLWGEHCMGLVVWVDDKAIDSLMMRVFGYPLTPHVKFRHSIDLGSTPGSSIADALAVVMRECEQPQSLLNRGITTQAVEDLLLSSLIYAAVDDGQFDSSPSGLRVGSVHLRRALEFIHHHLRDDMTVSQLASVAGVSVRTLQYEFARRFGVGPITMIRREKLRQVRMTLLDPAQDSGTIGDIAAKWGFFDAKYFAKMYFREFSERPSDTRRRHA